VIVEIKPGESAHSPGLFVPELLGILDIGEDLEVLGYDIRILTGTDKSCQSDPKDSLGKDSFGKASFRDNQFEKFFDCD
jgi:hypothetical protein